MATLPRASTTLSRTAGALASGSDLITVWAPVATNADNQPRRYGNVQDVFDRHGFCEGIDYLAMHVAGTGLPFIFVPLAIGTPGAISSEVTTGNSGTSVTTLTAAASGVMSEHEGSVKVLTGGTIGTDQIVLGVVANKPHI